MDLKVVHWLARLQISGSRQLGLSARLKCIYDLLFHFVGAQFWGVANVTLTVVHLIEMHTKLQNQHVCVSFAVNILLDTVLPGCSRVLRRQDCRMFCRAPVDFVQVIGGTCRTIYNAKPCRTLAGHLQKRCWQSARGSAAICRTCRRQPQPCCPS